MKGTTMVPARLTSVAAKTIQTDAGRSPTPRHGFRACTRRINPEAAMCDLGYADGRLLVPGDTENRALCVERDRPRMREPHRAQLPAPVVPTDVQVHDVCDARLGAATDGGPVLERPVIPLLAWGVVQLASPGGQVSQAVE